MTIVLVLIIAVLYGVGAYLVMQRNLSRIVIGLAVISHGANLMLLMGGGPAGRAPLVDEAATGAVSDPLPHALALTAIVITFGVTAFLLTLAYRSWTIRGTDEVEDDVEDARLARLVAARAAKEAAELERERSEADIAAMVEEEHREEEHEDVTDELSEEESEKTRT